MKETLESLEETGQNPPNRGPQEGLQKGLWEAYFGPPILGVLRGPGSVERTRAWIWAYYGSEGPQIGPKIGPK